MRFEIICECGQKMRAQEKHIGRETTCPKCHSPFVVPSPHDADDHAESTGSDPEFAKVPSQESDSQNWQAAQTQTVESEVGNGIDVTSSTAIARSRPASSKHDAELDSMEERLEMFRTALQAAKVTKVPNHMVHIDWSAPLTVGAVFSFLISFPAIVGCGYVIGVAASFIFAESERAYIFGFIVGASIALKIKHAFATRKRAAAASVETAWKARELGDEFVHYHKRLRQLIQDADVALSHARSEFSSRAFSPFFDQVELAAIKLSLFANNLERAHVYGNRYRNLLLPTENTFPKLVDVRGMIPDPTNALQGLAQVLRMAQTDYQFATIWEQRKTREAIVDGFDNLGDACQQLEAVVWQALRG